MQDKDFNEAKFRRSFSKLLVAMGAVQILPLCYLIWDSLFTSKGVYEPLSITIELYVGFLAASIAPIVIAMLIQNGRGMLAAKILLLIMLPFVLGEVCLPILIIFKHDEIALSLLPMLAAFIVHVIIYAIAGYLYNTSPKMK